MMLRCCRVIGVFYWCYRILVSQCYSVLVTERVPHPYALVYVVERYKVRVGDITVQNTEANVRCFLGIGYMYYVVCRTKYSNSHTKSSSSSSSSNKIVSYPIKRTRHYNTTLASDPSLEAMPISSSVAAEPTRSVSHALPSTVNAS